MSEAMAARGIVDRIRAVSPWTAAELFATGNLLFLAVDVWIAHSVNRFAEIYEWIPVIFSRRSKRRVEED